MGEHKAKRPRPATVTPAHLENVCNVLTARDEQCLRGLQTVARSLQMQQIVLARLEAASLAGRIRRLRAAARRLAVRLRLARPPATPLPPVPIPRLPDLDAMVDDVLTRFDPFNTPTRPRR